MGDPEEVEFTPRACGDCRAPLVGEFCHVCGQRDKPRLRNAIILAYEAFAEMFEFDSRVRRTYIPLMFKPGFLSNEWIAGRRTRYVPPVRLYLLISIVFFLSLASITRVDTSGLRDRLAEQSTVTSPDGERVRVPFTQRPGFTMNLPWLSDDTQNDLKRRIDRVAEHPDLLVRQAMSLLPQMMFLLLPLFAFILKVLYLFKRRLYIEHVILSLHTHSFLFLSFFLLIMLQHFRTWALGGVGTAPLGTAALWLQGALWTWIPIHLFIAQKRFYRQGWVMTTVKYLTTGFIYYMMLAFGFIALLLASLATV